MSLTYIVLVIIVVGIVLWLINSFLPMDPKVKRILKIVVIVVLVIWLLKVFGLWAYLSAIKI